MLMKILKNKKIILLSILTIITLIIFNINAEPDKKFTEKFAEKTLLSRLSNGGYVLYIRHGKTDSAKPDQYPIDLEDCETQRPLTTEGIEEIKKISEYIKKANIKAYTVISSPLCRAVISSKLLFGVEPIIENDLMYTAHLTTQEKIPVVNKTRELISGLNIPEGKNRIIVSHAPNLADLMGYFPETEGSVIVFKPLGNGNYEYIATILPKHWDDLLK